MISDFFESTPTALLERTLNFTERRHDLILQNIANAYTPGYVQQDAPVADFEKSLQDAVDQQRANFNASLEFKSTDTVSFARGSSDVMLTPKPVIKSPVFHDRGVRSMESMMTDLLDNAQVHNMAATLLQNRYGVLKQAIQLHV